MTITNANTTNQKPEPYWRLSGAGTAAASSPATGPPSLADTTITSSPGRPAAVRSLAAAQVTCRHRIPVIPPGDLSSDRVGRFVTGGRPPAEGTGTNEIPDRRGRRGRRLRRRPAGRRRAGRDRPGAPAPGRRTARERAARHRPGRDPHRPAVGGDRRPAHPWLRRDRA